MTDSAGPRTGARGTALALRAQPRQQPRVDDHERRSSAGVDVAFFLLVYDRTIGRLVQLIPHTDAERDAALAAQFELEREHRLEPNLEIVVLGARDEDTIRLTHARYFRTVGELIANARSISEPD